MNSVGIPAQSRAAQCEENFALERLKLDVLDLDGHLSSDLGLSTMHILGSIQARVVRCFAAHDCAWDASSVLLWLRLRC